MPDEQLEAAIVDVLREIAGLAFGEAAVMSGGDGPAGRRLR